jgi:hypothetical protein
MDMKRNRHRLSMIGLFLLMVLLAGLACTPSLDTIFRNSSDDSSGDESAAPPSDQDSSVDQAAPSPTPTTEVPAADGVFERASHDPAANMGPPDQHDAFDGNNPLFFERMHTNSAAWYGMDGRYHMTFKFGGRWVWYWSDVYGYDFYADVIVINADHCVPQDSGGLIFRGHLAADAGYMFGVTCDGSYFIGATVYPGSAGYICWVGPGTAVDCEPGAAANSVVDSEYINSGPGAANRIGVMAEGTTYTFYINGHQVESFTQTSLPLAEGNFTLYIGAGQDDVAEVMFDDFSLWELP